MSAPRLSVIVATYEWPEALGLVLRALSEQSDRNFEVVVADDGSGADTAEIVSRWEKAFVGELKHVWQPDLGWRKSRILNVGALEAQGDYLLYVDGDSLPRPRFIAAVRRAVIPGWFVASKRLHLTPRLSRQVIETQLPVWRWSTLRWVVGAPRELVAAPRETGRPGVLLPIRDRRRPWRHGQQEFSPPFDAFGYCFGVFRRDFERVNGFDMRFVGWGAEDVDIAVRLRRLGLKCGWPGPQATMLHLWHPPKEGTMKSNNPLRQATQQSTRVAAVKGLRELSAELAAQVSANRVGPSSSSSGPVKR